MEKYFDDSFEQEVLKRLKSYEDEDMFLVCCEKEKKNNCYNIVDIFKKTDKKKIRSLIAKLDVIKFDNPFCKLENDLKTYNITKDYITILNNNEPIDNKVTNIETYDLHLHVIEAKKHLETHGINENDSIEIRNAELDEWFAKHGLPYRVYLTTTKLFTVTCIFEGKNENNLSFEEFSKTIEKFNNLIYFYNLMYFFK